MVALLPSMLASQGPFGPTALTCLLLPLLLLGPFILLLVVARSLLGSEPLPVWAAALGMLGWAGLGYVFWAEPLVRAAGFWRAWQIAAIGALVLLPVAFLWDAWKRGWFHTRKRYDDTGDF